MEFLKNHYEKITLSIVLLILAVAAGYLPLEVSNVRRSLEEATRRYIQRTPQPLEPINLSTAQMVIARIESSTPLKIGLSHSIFHPIAWIQTPDGNITPAETLRIRGLTIERIRPLVTRIVYRGVNTTGDRVRYEFEVTREAAPNRADRTPRVYYLDLGEKRDFLKLAKIEGDPKNPEKVVLEIEDKVEPVVITKEKPYEEHTGYAVDLRDAEGNRRFNDIRQGDRLLLGRHQAYNVVAIGPDEVTLEELQTRKRVTLLWTSS